MRAPTAMPLVDVSVTLNTLALAGVSFTLLFAFWWQLAYNELPCPLCLLQRVAFVLAGVGFLLNMRFGPSPLHYGVVLVSALGGMVAAGRQVLLHIAPGDPGYGDPLFSLHFYTWAFVAFVGMIAFCAVMLAIDRNRADNPTARKMSVIGSVIMLLFFAIIVANAISTTLECGFGACPDDPTEYLWLP